jgi:outer membrane immunogenic protein
MQKTLLAATAAALLGMGGAVSAADIYSGGSTKDAPVPLYAPVASWTGFYVGVNGGYAWGNDGTLSAFACEYCYWERYYTDDAGRAKLSPSGWFGGGQIGYNWQSGSLVIGIETDIQGAGISDKASLSLLEGDASAFAKSQLDWFGTVRGRLGFISGDMLFYGTAGFAYGGVKDTLNVSILGDTKTRIREETQTGLAAGGGVEYKINPSWSFKAEYLFIDLGSDKLSASAGDGYCAWATASLRADHSYNIVRAGLNYRLGETYQPLK